MEGIKIKIRQYEATKNQRSLALRRALNMVLSGGGKRKKHGGRIRPSKRGRPNFIFDATNPRHGYACEKDAENKYTGEKIKVQDCVGNGVFRRKKNGDREAMRYREANGSVCEANMEDLTCDADKNMGSDALDVFFKTSKHPPYEEIKTIPFFTSKRWSNRDAIVALLGVDPLRLQHMPMRVKNSKDLASLRSGTMDWRFSTSVNWELKTHAILLRLCCGKRPRRFH